jgi:hypothetical protein
MTSTVPTQVGVCHVAWCNGNHLPPTRDYREHRSTGVRPTHGLYASVSWLEPLNAVARYSDAGPYVYFRAGDVDVSLPVGQADRLAAVMDELGRGDAADLLRRMVALVTDGGETPC